MVTHISKSPEETAILGEELGRTLGPGMLVGLIGDLGAGKTQFVKGVARGLGVSERVHSPTFALLNTYASGRLPCYHIDLYRLETAKQLASSALDDYFHQTDGVTLIEWFDRLLQNEVAPKKALIVRFREEGETQREIIYEYPGT